MEGRSEDAPATQQSEIELEPSTTARTDDADKAQEQSATDGAKPQRLTGKALRWNEGGFGFIKPDLAGEKDIFCHSSNIVDGKCLREGDSVEYEKGYDDNHKKWRAENVTGSGGSSLFFSFLSLLLLSLSLLSLLSLPLHLSVLA